MKKLKKFILLNICFLPVFVSISFAESQATGEIPRDFINKAAEILRATKSSGGLAVHLGSSEWKLTAAIGKSGNYVVHGLVSPDPAASGSSSTAPGKLGKARDYVDSLGLYGKVCFDRLGNRLPYIDNLVNLIIVEDSGGIQKAEMMRVLAPGGRIYDLASGKIEKKPAMSGIDDWTHFMYDSTGNAVSHDTIVSPPRYLKWKAGPRWSRSHHQMGSMPGLVAAKGRIFSIIDEGYIDRKQMEAKPAWNLIARDAYNGIVLWRRPFKTFHDAFWGKKSGPIQLPERLVTDGERVYVTLEINGPVSAVDAVTGDLIRDYKGTVGTEEILFNNNLLFLLRNPLRETGNHKEPIRLFKGKYRGSSPHGENKKEIMAVDAGTGEILWKKQSVVLATTLAADSNHVYFHDGIKIVCLERDSGKIKWRTSPVKRLNAATAQFTPELIVHKGVVFFAGGLRYDHSKSEPLYAFDAKSGEKLWDAELSGGVYKSTKYSVFAIGDLVWTGDVRGGGPIGKLGLNPYTGRDLRTGEVIKEFTRDTVGYLSSHSRCYPNKATVKYLMPNIRGVEMVDFEKEKWIANNWIRAECSFGLMPSHGMIYTPPHPCTCYAQSKLKGFNAVYGDAMGSSKNVADPQKKRLETHAQTPLTTKSADAADWPVYRGNNLRTGSTKSRLGSKLSTDWTAVIGGKLSALTVADGRLFVSQIDSHKIHAISAEDGRKLWSFTAGGRVDSPPTLYRGRVYFGCQDGYLYCLNASGGSLLWRFMAAADDRRLISYGQIESVHPVHGSVLIHDGIIYCLAGRSMFLDGGLRLYRLDADTGKELSVNVMDKMDPFTGESIQKKTIKQSMPPSMPDILSCDGKRIYMGVQPFDLQGKRTETATHNEDLSWDTIFSLHQGEGRHIFSPQGFLDDTQFHRRRWIYGKVYFGGHQDEWRAGRVAPSGSILVCDEENVLGYYGEIGESGMKSLYNTLFSVSKDAGLLKEVSSKRKSHLKHNWIIKSPLYINAMLLAKQLLFVTGVTEHREKSYLQVYSAPDGKKLAEYELPSMAVWDGMATAYGRLYISLKNGTIISRK